MQNTLVDQRERGFQQRPTMEGGNDNMHHTGLCTATLPLSNDPTTVKTQNKSDFILVLFLFHKE